MCGYVVTGAAGFRVGVEGGRVARVKRVAWCWSVRCGLRKMFLGGYVACMMCRLLYRLVALEIVRQLGRRFGWRFSRMLLGGLLDWLLCRLRDRLLARDIGLA